MPVPDYVTRMRAHIGHDLLLLPGAGAVVRDEQGRILLLRRSDNGQWSLPAGMIEPGEQPADAVVREVFEETGVRVEIERLAGVGSHDSVYPNGDHCQYLVAWFRCRPVGGEARPDGEESLDVGWFAPDALPDSLGALSRLRITTTRDSTGAPWFTPPAARR